LENYNAYTTLETFRNKITRCI